MYKRRSAVSQNLHLYCYPEKHISATCVRINDHWFQQKILTAFTKIPSLGSCLKARACIADSAVTPSLDTL